MYLKLWISSVMYKEKDVILVDDMVDTAGTLVKAAEVLKRKKDCKFCYGLLYTWCIIRTTYDRIEKGDGWWVSYFWHNSYTKRC